MRPFAIVMVLVAAGCGDDQSTTSTGMDMAVVIQDLTPPGDMVVLKPECDVFGNSGCPSGQKCTIGTQNGTPRDLCAPLSATTVALGASCMSVDIGGGRTGDNCAAGLICLDFPGDGPHCRKPCFTRSDCPGQTCTFTTPTGTQRVTDAGGTQSLHACANDDGCDPVAQTVCTGGRKCWLSPPDDVGRVGVCLMPLAPGGMAGDACDSTRQAGCAPGFRCDNFNFCRRYCYYSAADGGAGGAGGCPAAEGVCDRFEFSGPTYGICGVE